MPTLGHDGILIWPLANNACKWNVLRQIIVIIIILLLVIPRTAARNNRPLNFLASLSHILPLSFQLPALLIIAAVMEVNAGIAEPAKPG